MPRRYSSIACIGISSRQFLYLGLDVHQGGDLLGEYLLGLGNGRLYLNNLLVHKFVDLLHVFEHSIRLLVQSLQFGLVASQLITLVHDHLGRRVSLHGLLLFLILGFAVGC